MLVETRQWLDKEVRGLQTFTNDTLLREAASSLILNFFHLPEPITSSSTLEGPGPLLSRHLHLCSPLDIHLHSRLPLMKIPRSRLSRPSPSHWTPSHSFCIRYVRMCLYISSSSAELHLTSGQWHCSLWQWTDLWSWRKIIDILCSFDFFQYLGNVGTCTVCIHTCGFFNTYRFLQEEVSEGPHTRAL